MLHNFDSSLFAWEIANSHTYNPTAHAREAGLRKNAKIAIFSKIYKPPMHDRNYTKIMANNGSFRPYLHLLIANASLANYKCIFEAVGQV